METWDILEVEVSSDGRIRHKGLVIGYLPFVKIVVRDMGGVYVGSYRDLGDVLQKLGLRSAGVLNVLRGRQKYHSGYSFSYV